MPQTLCMYLFQHIDGDSAWTCFYGLCNKLDYIFKIFCASVLGISIYIFSILDQFLSIPALKSNERDQKMSICCRRYAWDYKANPQMQQSFKTSFFIGNQFMVSASCEYLLSEKGKTHLIFFFFSIYYNWAQLQNF